MVIVFVNYLQTWTFIFSKCKSYWKISKCVTYILLLFFCHWIHYQIDLFQLIFPKWNHWLNCKGQEQKNFLTQEDFSQEKENYCNEKKVWKNKKLFFAIMVKFLFGHPKKEPFLLSEAVSILRFHCMIGKNVRLSKNVYNEAFQNIW